MRLIAILASAMMLISLGIVPGHAEKRLALVIGNKDYKSGVGALTNPLNDIRIVGDALKSVGFEVLKPVQNATRTDMLRAIYEFASKLKAAGPEAVGFLYYSGHGVASAGENYLIPIDIDEPSTVQLSIQGVRQSEVLAVLRNEAPNAAHYLVLDACRNTLQGARGGKGFVPVGQQNGVLVAFSTEPGKTASDTGQGSGPYAAALATELVKPGQSDLIMFHNVRVDVMDKTNGDQVPWTEDGIQRRSRPLFAGETPAQQQQQVAVVVPPVVPSVPASPCGIGGATVASLSSRPACPLSAAEERSLKPKDVFKECTNCPEMVVVPAGRFTMGSPKSEAGRYDGEDPQHGVTIGKPVAVGKFHVTVDQFAAFVAETGYDAGSKCYTTEGGKTEERDGRSWRNPGFAQAGSHPAVCLNWNDAKAYAAWLAKKTGKGYRLLTEAEWEYAARAGTATRFSFGDDERDLCRYGNGLDQTAKSKITNADNWAIAPCSDDYAYTAPVGSFAPNAFGMYDMHGNAWQSLEDCWNDNYVGAPLDGSAWTSGDCSRHVRRGGSWYSLPRNLRSADRAANFANLPGNDNDGFRLGRTLTP